MPFVVFFRPYDPIAGFGDSCDWVLGQSQGNTISETFKNLCEAFAWACAGGFFLYKAFSGHIISNLSLSLTCQRAHSGLTIPSMDYLVVTANLKKGDRGAVTLHDLQAYVSPTMQNEASFKKLAGTRRLTSTRSSTTGILRIENIESGDNPLLNFPPGEEAVFSAWFKVPAAEPCTVEVTVLGGWSWHEKTRYQWRASTISLPCRMIEERQLLTPRLRNSGSSPQ